MGGRVTVTISIGSTGDQVLWVVDGRRGTVFGRRAAGRVSTRAQGAMVDPR